MKTSLLAEWFKQNKMVCAEEREKMINQPPASMKAFPEWLPLLKPETSMDIDLLDGVLQQLTEDNKRLKAAIREIQKNLIRAVDVIGEVNAPAYVLRTIDKCDEALEE